MTFVEYHFLQMWHWKLLSGLSLSLSDISSWEPARTGGAPLERSGSESEPESELTEEAKAGAAHAGAEYVLGEMVYISLLLRVVLVESLTRPADVLAALTCSITVRPRFEQDPVLRVRFMACRTIALA